MTPPEPGDGTPTGPSEPGVTGPTGPIRRRTSTLVGDLVGEGGPVRRFLSRWAFPLFILFIAIIGRSVLLPFVFAGLIAYILAPIIRGMTERKDGTLRMPRGLAIVICYIVFIAGIVGFMFILVPRLANDFQRIGTEAPALYKKVNEEWTPQLARWLEKRFPSLAPPKVEAEASPIVPDVPLPPGTAFTVTPLPDGRLAIQLAPGGVDIKPARGGGFLLIPNETVPEPLTLEEKLRAFVGNAVTGLQSKVNDLVAFGQRLVAGVAQGIFLFFLTLMIAAFMLIDMEKVHGFLRSLFPTNVRDDYDVIIAGIDRGLSGVIRGQLLICLVNGGLTYVGLLIFQVKYSLILAVVAAVMSLIPIFGSILSTVPIVMAALVSGESGLDFFRGVVMTLWIVGIHFLEANFLNPKIIGTAAKIHPVLVIFSLILGQSAYGLVGALLAVPILSAIQVIFMFFYRKRWLDPSAPRRRPSITEPPPVPPPASPPVSSGA
jgi:predicted PurR-regulated permease PerM